MIPVFLIPVIVQIATKLIDLAFDKIHTLPVDKQVKVSNKIVANDKKAEQKKLEKLGDDDYGY